MINHKLKIYIKHLHFTLLQSQYTFTQLLPKVFLDKYNKTFSCDLTWSIMSKCIMKKNWTCSAAPLEITLGSCFIRQFMRLIVHFYSELTSNHHRVFVITSFCDHMWNLNMLFIAFYIAAQIFRFTHSSQENHIQTIFYRNPVFIVLYNL